MFTGAGTVLNVVTVLVGSGIGMLLGHRFPQRTRDVVTDALGLVTLLIAALSVAAIVDPALTATVGDAAMLIVLGSLLIGGITGSLLRIESGLEGLGERLQRLTSRRRGGADETWTPDSPDRHRFVDGFVTASLVFCVGPLTILGALSDGMGQGIDELALKSTLDGFAAIAFAATLGGGVALSAVTVAIVQGALTLLGVAVGEVATAAQIAALTATGGLLLVGVALRLLRLKPLPVGDLLPALLVAPLLVTAVAAVT